MRRKYPQFKQDEIFGLQDAFRKLDVDDKGYVDEATTIRSVQNSERQPYDVVRQALKEVDLDSSRRVELDDYVGVCIDHLIPLLTLMTVESDAMRAAHLKAPRLLACSAAHIDWPSTTAQCERCRKWRSAVPTISRYPIENEWRRRSHSGAGVVSKRHTHDQ